MTAGEALRGMLAAIGVPQSAFAQDAGISAKHLNQLIVGRAHFTPESTALIADGLAIRLLAIDARERMQVIRRGTPDSGGTDG